MMRTQGKKKHTRVIRRLAWKPERKESFMTKFMNKTKSPQVFISGQPNTAPVSAPQPIHEISHPRPIATSSPAHEDIARRAYQIYVEKGYPQDQSEQNWKQAEREQLDRGLATFLSR
jgi:hypothetical protein